ncbi:MAG TPA: DUF116 domain-containing protein [Geobacteraceae bacterium]|nr:DUF116 domain-containing protein [Geobacteraceae bacterium]
MGLTCLLIAGFILILWWAEKTGLAGIHPALPGIMGTILAVAAGIIVLGTALLVLTTLLGKDIFLTRLLRGAAIRLLLPAIEFIGKIVGIPRDSIRQSFIAMNNSLVLSQRLSIKPDRLLILLPHCIQLFDCDIKVTGDIDKCVRCGKCDINGLADIGKKYGIDISVATGGTLARKVIMEKRPKLVIAVACEGDLTSGIKDCYPLPVLGILNDRPFGPCFNTRVETQKIDDALKVVMG